MKKSTIMEQVIVPETFHLAGLQEEHMRLKRITALFVSMITAVSLLAGCGGVDKDKTVATLNGEPVKLGVANFAVRLQQANADDFYRQLFGDTVWTSDMYQSGTTMEESFKEDAITSIQEMYTLQLHMGDYGISVSDEEKAAITAAAETFMSDNSQDAIEALGATKEIIEEYLTLTTIQSKMRDAIVAGVDTEVSDEEAKTSSYSYVAFSESSMTGVVGVDSTESTENAEDAATAVKEKAEEFAEAIKTESLEDAAEAYGYNVNTATFTQDGEGTDEDLFAAIKDLKEGETTGAVETENGYFVARIDSELDEEATENTRQTIISARQDDFYEETLEGFKESDEWKLDEKVWKTVSFDNLFTTVEESTETVEATENATELQ